MYKPWTNSRLHSFIVSALRTASRKYPPRYETLNDAKTDKRINKKTGRLAQHYLCECCGLEFPAKDVQVDHILPVVDPAKGFISWDVYIERMFCDKVNLQVLCTACHNEKTKLERRVKKEKNASK